MPPFVGAPYVSQGLLEDLELDTPGLRAGLYIAYPSSGQVPRKVTAFRDFFVESMAKAPFA